MRRLLSLALASLLTACAAAVAVQEAPAPTAAPVIADDPRQIHWERSFEDALALARTTDRPLLVAVNMDGESAGERIVREEYKDPAFVASTRAFVCVVASFFRHTPRDHDDDGRRIACPRLGAVTCGEHMALEPLLYDKFLSDADRVAPRHALVLQDGKKAFDEFLLFDLRDLDRLVANAAQHEVERRARAGLALEERLPARLDVADAENWRAWEGERSHRARAVLEDALAGAREESTLLALDALAAAGDAGSMDALRVVLARTSGRAEPVRSKAVATARALKLEAGVGNLARDGVRGLGRTPGELAPNGAETHLALLAELDGVSAATRTLLLACAGTGAYGGAAAQALVAALGARDETWVRAELVGAGGPCSLDEVLAIARLVWSPGGPQRIAGPLPRAGYASDAMPEAAELEKTLAQLEQELQKGGEAPELLARYAKAALDLGRRRIEANQQGAQFLFEDAERQFELALKAEPRSMPWWIERARNAYFLGRFELQARCGREVVAIAPSFRDALPTEAAAWLSETGSVRAESAERKLALATLDDAWAIEGLRWVGDADARLIAERSGKDPAAEIAGFVEGARALGVVAASPFATGKDWTSFASIFGAVGLWREELALLKEGALRLPADQELRQRLNAALWNGGRIDLAPEFAQEIARAHPRSADAAWFAGYAWLLAAEDARRSERGGGAVEAYATARERFARSIELNPAYAESAKHYVAMAWLGSGFARVMEEGQQLEAARDLLEGIETNPAVASARDGLDREAIDLVDAVLEWRASGPSPVDAVQLSADLDYVDFAHGADWALAISDAMLREALRADGRNPKRAMKDTVDAAMKPIRLELGLPTEEGDRYLGRAVSVAMHALSLRDDESTRWMAAQCSSIAGERRLERGDVTRAVPELERAANALGMAVPPKSASSAEWEALAKQLREKLGPARPRNRPGR
ncbi:MAG: hypothetical protein HZA53_06620 [Planctomycetes bacterium]|nr:hypothetical protein [Planctomycetota bacterium]